MALTSGLRQTVLTVLFDPTTFTLVVTEARTTGSGPARQIPTGVPAGEGPALPVAAILVALLTLAGAAAASRRIASRCR